MWKKIEVCGSERVGGCREREKVGGRGEVGGSKGKEGESGGGR